MDVDIHAARRTRVVTGAGSSVRGEMEGMGKATEWEVDGENAHIEAAVMQQLPCKTVHRASTETLDVRTAAYWRRSNSPYAAFSLLILSPPSYGRTGVP